MNTTTRNTTDLESYLAAVRANLADLPDSERDDLLEDLEQHLAEVAAESDDPLSARLGPADAYAAELRSSAGLAPSQTIRAYATSPQRHLRDLATAVRTDPRVEGALAFARDLQPGWWVLRGYLAALIWSSMFEPWWSEALPFPRLMGRRSLGVLLTIGLIALSVHVGRRARGSRVYRGLAVAATVFVLVWSLPGLAGALLTPATVGPPEFAEDFDPYTHAFSEESGGLLRADGAEITNLYPYDADGEPLSDVRLYDQDGNAVEIVIERAPDGRPVVTSFPLDEDGVPVTNAFPQRQAARDQPGPEMFPWEPDFDPDLDYGARELHEDAGIERRRFGERPDLTVPPLEDTAAEREPVDDESPSSAGDGEPGPRPRQE